MQALRAWLFLLAGGLVLAANVRLPAQGLQPLIPPQGIGEDDVRDLREMIDRYRELQNALKDKPKSDAAAFRDLDKAYQTLVEQERTRQRMNPPAAANLWQELHQVRRRVRIAFLSNAEDPFALENRRDLAPDEELLIEHGVKLDAEALIQFFRARTLTKEQRAEAIKLIKELGGETFREREQAMQQLMRRGPAVLELLRMPRKEEDLEASRRAQRALLVIQERDLPRPAISAALKLLEKHRPAQLVDILLAYAPYASHEEVADDVRALLTANALQKGNPHPSILAALADEVPMRRAAAGEALARAGSKLNQAASKNDVRKLLKDPEAIVRFRVGVALTHAGDKEGLRVLVDSLPQFTMAQAWLIEDMLCRLAAGKNPPAVSLGMEEGSRGKLRSAWGDWLVKNDAKLDFAALTSEPPLLGYTMLVLLDQGRVMELDNRQQLRWSIDGLVFPLDVQRVDEKSILVAEYHGGRVTQRDQAGNIVWKHEIGGALVAQRLPSGNTFISTDSQMIEVDRDGKEVLNLSPPQDGDRIMKASKLPGGDIAILTNTANIYRLDPTGKIKNQFSISLGTRLFGGRIHMLQTGNVLVPHNAENKVIEYDKTGKIVWEVAVDAPIAASRLPNGNTLVTSMLPQRGAVEFNRNGEEVWTYKTETRVTRALRR